MPITHLAAVSEVDLSLVQCHLVLAASPLSRCLRPVSRDELLPRRVLAVQRSLSPARVSVMPAESSPHWLSSALSELLHTAPETIAFPSVT